MAPPNAVITGQTVPEVDDAIDNDSANDEHGGINLIEKSVFQLVYPHFATKPEAKVSLVSFSSVVAVPASIIPLVPALQD